MLYAIILYYRWHTCAPINDPLPLICAVLIAATIILYRHLVKTSYIIGASLSEPQMNGTAIHAIYVYRYGTTITRNRGVSRNLGRWVLT